jgi:hypothetical protein
VFQYPRPTGRRLLLWQVSEIWIANAGGYSFVISRPGLHGEPGFVASWRLAHSNNPAVRVGGSPFNTFAEAEKACEAFLEHLTE